MHGLSPGKTDRAKTNVLGDWPLYRRTVVVTDESLNSITDQETMKPGFKASPTKY